MRIYFNYKVFYFSSIIILLCQIFRSISLSAYTSILLLSYILTYASFLYYKKVKYTQLELYFLFLLAIYIPLISFINEPMSQFIIGFSRSLVVLPFLMFSLGLKNELTTKDFDNFKKIYIIFVVAAALSLVYQNLLGQIGFFAEHSYRYIDGKTYIRYASFAGSLTAYGSFAPIAVIFLISGSGFSKFCNLIFHFLILVGAILSYQKAALLGVISIYFIYLSKPLFSFSLRKGKIFYIISALCLMIIGLYVLTISTEFKYTLINSTQDLYNRFTDLPAKNIEYFNASFFNYIFGIGFEPLSGILGYVDIPMAHNNFVDMILSGGILYLCIYLLILIYVFKNTEDFAIRLALLYILMMMAIGAFSIYVPAVAVLVGVLIGYVGNGKQKHS
ncbi:O-antigen ligase like membrane family protein [Francisella tularensis subsp. novicida]|nr:O-antigen ligase like membrane family protein [Francisella tularensis subsp. novicida]KFJ66375.1 O-antigen ligase like membrane family protein [Francisella tularensis subsp. novicida]